MPQMAIIQPAAPKRPPQTRAADAPGNKEQNKFSPHLDKAITNNKKQQQSDQNEDRTITPSKAKKNDLPENNRQSLKSQKSQAPEDTLDLAAVANTVKQTDGPTENSGLSDTAKLPSSGINAAFSQLQQIEPSAEQVQNAAVASSGKPTIIGKTVLPESMLTVPAPAMAEPNSSSKTVPLETMLNEIAPAIAEPSIENAIKPTTGKEQSELISQLQRIISQSDEAGTVSITKAPDATVANSIPGNIHGVLLPASPEKSAQVVVPASVETASVTTSSLLVAGANNAEKAVEKPTQQLTGSKQDSLQQYFDPKTPTKDLADNNPNFLGHRHGNEQPQQAMGAGSQNVPSSGLSSGPEQTNTFSQILTTTQQTTTQPTGDTAKPIILPSGTMVQEDDIIQQMSHKLQISSRLMDSRINIKLHPAELGSLKIDLTVKEGSIRANVVAQSQHTSAILEKNMTKLKNILENQGYTVDEISITTESESVNDFDLFDRQLFSNNDYAPKAPKGRREDEAVFTMADNVFAAPAMNTGVNVKI